MAETNQKAAEQGMNKAWTSYVVMMLTVMIVHLLPPAERIDKWRAAVKQYVIGQKLGQM